MRVAIIGAGLTGLTAGLRLSQQNHLVTIFEKENYLGGLASSFQAKNWAWPLEFFFHHLFTSDQAIKNLINEVGLGDKLFYVRPKTAIWYADQTFQFDSISSILKAPFFSLPEKIRAILVTGYLKAMPFWQELEKTTAAAWLTQFYGQKTFQLLWQPLLKAKFGHSANQVNMAWFWARIKKRSQSLGYLENGFQILIDQLAERIKTNGGQIILKKEIKNLNQLKKFDRIIITTPTSQFFQTKLPKMIGSLSLILELKKPFLKNNTYWLNINDSRFPFVAVVEHTNFVSSKHYANKHLVYIGGYYPQNHPFFKMTKSQILKKFLPYLKKINPQYNFSLLTVHYSLFTNLFAQLVTPVNYSQIKPRFKTAIPHVYLANMQMVYPYDRGTNYAVELGERIGREVAKNS